MGSHRLAERDDTEDVQPWVSRARRSWQSFRETEWDADERGMPDSVDLTNDSASSSSSSSSSERFWATSEVSYRQGVQDRAKRKRSLAAWDERREKSRKSREEKAAVPSSRAAEPAIESRLIDLCSDDDDDEVIQLDTSSSSLSSSSSSIRHADASVSSHSVRAEDNQDAIVSMCSPRSDASSHVAPQQLRPSRRGGDLPRSRSAGKRFGRGEKAVEESEQEREERRKKEQEKAKLEKMQCSSTVVKSFTCPICFEDQERVSLRHSKMFSNT